MLNTGNDHLGPNETMPLVSFILFTYNQEHFVREAIMGAFAQTYPRLEIILSDDCSSDQSFAIMHEMGESYQGPHKIVLNRNEANLGSIEHVNLMLKRAAGDFVVMAAGDDVSYPNRCELLVAEWLKRGKPLVVHSRKSHVVTSDSQRSGRMQVSKPARGYSAVERIKNFIYYGNGGISGATIAVDSKMYSYFGPIDRKCFAEDKVFAFRALLLGETCLVDQELITYRIHDNNMSTIKRLDQHSKRQAWLQESLESSMRFNCRWQQALSDLKRAKSGEHISDSDFQTLWRMLARMQKNEDKYLNSRNGASRILNGTKLWLNRQRSFKWLLKSIAGAASVKVPGR